VGDATHEAEIIGRATRPHDRSRTTNGFRVSHDGIRSALEPRPAMFADPARPTSGSRTAPPVSAEPTPAPTAVTGLPIQSLRARCIKRTLDLVAALPLCVAFAVVYPFVAVAMKATSKGPVLFRQVRVGRDGAPVAVFKFRSMSVDAEGRLEADPELYRQYVENGFKIPASIDPRITKVGRFLRRTSIDELPQALCLLSGAMSLVGPRPILAEQVPVLYKDDVGYYLACKPGLTGLWQVSGRSTVTDDQRAQLDVSYASEWTLLGDLRIILRTVPVVLTAHGAH
jgi:lipopolysaccharide/colanic/teichoic acid biosynthesis glycosyltransferase